MCSNSPKFGVKDMDPIDFLCNLSGQSREQCIQYYEISNYDLNTAAMIILESNNPLPQEETITNQSQSSYSLPPLATPASPASLSTLPPVSSRIHPSPASFTSSTSNLIETIDISEICAKFHEQKWSLEDEEEASLTAAAIAAVEDADELPNSSFLTTNTDVFPDNYYHNFKILIPRYRLDEVFDKLIPPQTIELHEIWNSNEILPIPGGMTICEVCSNNLDEMESYLASLAQILGRYHMSHCFILDTITNKQKRKEFLIQMKNIFSNLFQIESKELHHEFIEQVNE